MPRLPRLNWHHLFLEGWHPVFWVAATAMLLYFKTLTFRFTYMDDTMLILDNLWLLRDHTHFFTLFTTTVFSDGADFFYRPLLMASLMPDAILGGPAPFMYHLTNILLHAIASALVFRFFSTTGSDTVSAFFLALLFAVHPALSQAVAWIPGRNDVLLTIFVLSAVLCWRGMLEHRSITRGILCLLFFNLALYTKETAVMLIPLGILHMLFAGRYGVDRPRMLKLLIASIISLIIFAALRNSALSSGSPFPFTLNTMLASFQNIPLALLQYLGKVFLPFNLSGLPVVKDIAPVFGGIAVALVAVVIILTKRYRLQYTLGGLLWFVIFLLPTFLEPDFRFEHRLYLPMIGILIMLDQLLRSHPLLTTRTPFQIAGAAVIVVFAGMAFAHADIFISRIGFWQDAVRTSPSSSSAHNGLGVAYVANLKTTEAIREFNTAISLNRRNRNPYLNLAGIYLESAHYDKAETALARAVALYPNDALAWYITGLLRYQQDRPDEAVQCWHKAIALNPHYFYAHRTLAAYYHHTGNAEAAAKALQSIQRTFNVTLSLPPAHPPLPKEWVFSYSMTQQIPGTDTARN